MSAAVAPPWTCPQCGRRVPGREPRCHCGYERAHAPPASVVRAPSAPVTGARRPAVLAAVVVVGVLGGVLMFVAVRRLDTAPSAARTVSPLARGEATYPALPPLPAVKARSARLAPRAASAPAASPNRAPPRPQGEAELDLSLRRVAADTSELEVGYWRFAAACVAPPSYSTPIREGDWLASLKTARLLPGVTLRERGATVDCETARKTLVTRADGLKSDLDAAERLAQTSGMRAEHWRTLLGVYGLEAWTRY